MNNFFVQEKTINKPCLLSKRLSWNNGEIIAKILSSGPKAQAAIKQVQKKIDSGQYQFEECLCFCGESRGKLISEIDRYGFYYPLVICIRCGLIRANPRMNRNAYENFYANEYRDSYGGGGQPIEELFEIRRAQHRMKYKFIAANVSLPEKAVIVDIGCDFGTMLEQFSNDGHNVFGCDYGIEHLEYGREKTGLENLLNGGYEILEGFKAKADLVILSHVIEHFLELEQALLEIRKLLKPNGICYVALPGTYGIIKNSFLKNDLIGLLQNAHTYQFSLNSLRYVMECCGYAFVKGTEEIESFFRYSDKFRSKNDFPPNESILVAEYLRAAEKKFLIRERMERWLKILRMDDIAKKIINRLRK